MQFDTHGQIEFKMDERTYRMIPLANSEDYLYTRFAVTSVQLLQFTKWHSITGSYKRSGTAFYFDGTLDYFGQGHWPYGLLVIVMLRLVNILPVLFLLFYPFVWFHSLLSFCKLHKEGLIAVGDVFTGPFKHGGDSGTPDSRLFVSCYLILRLVIVSLVGSFSKYWRN